MKVIRRLLLPSLLLTTALSSAADADNNSPFGADGGQLLTYLRNFGLYFGYDISNPPASDSISGSKLLDLSSAQTPQQSLFETVLGAVPVSATSNAAMLFVPSSTPSYSSLNDQANTTFKTPPYSTSSPQTVSANNLIDQQTYQQDPVSQAVLNILSTPDYTYCTNNDNTEWLPGCPALNQATPILYENQVANNVIGPLPDTATYFTYKYNQALLGQLNSNTLIAPLLYTTTDDSADKNSPGSSGTGSSTATDRLTATNQAQAAASFIRYATGAVSPLALPKRQDYDKLYTAATTPDKNGAPTLQQMQAQATLSNYLASLRVYAAQSSVGFGNLYYMFSKRLPQNTLGTDGSSARSSQALSEFTMATWRLFNPADPTNRKTTWLTQINSASSATVEKEMVTLLAEINYQLYLNRQQEERLLLTNTLLLLQNAKASQPTASSLAATTTASE